MSALTLLSFWFSTGWLIGDDGEQRSSSLHWRLNAYSKLHYGTFFSPRGWLNPIKFRLHGEITFSSLGGTLLPKHLIISRFSHFVSSITTVQTSCIKPVDAASLSPFISCQLSGLQGEGTRTGSYNRPSGGWGRRGAMFVCAHKRAVLNMSHESDSGRGADPCWWPAADGIPACRFNMGHGHEGSSDPNTDPSNPTWVPFQSDPRHPLFCTM